MGRIFKVICFYVFITMAVVPSLSAQLVVDTAGTVEHFVQDVLVGSGVSISNVSYTGSKVSIGTFSNGNTTNLGIDEGIMISTGSVFNAVGPNTVANKATNTKGSSDPQLLSISGGFPIYDATVLEFDFTPTSDTLKFKYIFGSEEYPEWVGTMYNDVFGFFINGQNPSGGVYANKNIAYVPGSNSAVSVNTINNGNQNNGPCINCSYYIDNENGSTIEFDGFTTILTAWVLVTPCQSYHIKIAIGDAADHSYDSGVFLEKNSFSSYSVDMDVDYTNPIFSNGLKENCGEAIVSFKLPYPSSYNRTVHYNVLGSATEGIDYNVIGDSIVIPAGSDSVSLVIEAFADQMVEGTENIQLVVQTNSCANDTVEIEIYDYENLSFNLGMDTALCLNESLTLNPTLVKGQSPFVYNWSGGGSSPQMIVNPSQSQTVQLEVIDACSISYTDSIQIQVNSLPIVSLNTLLDTLCKGVSQWIYAQGATTYQWTANNSIQQNMHDSILVKPNTSTLYTVIGKDLNMCSDTTQIQVSLYPIPNLQVQKNKTLICVGDSMRLTASGMNSYSWAPNTSLSNSLSSVVWAQPLTSQQYVVNAIDNNGCVDSATVNVKVENLPNLSFGTSALDLCKGSKIDVLVSGAINYLWSPSTILNPTIGNKVQAFPDSSQFVYVIGTNQHGCVNQDSIWVNVHKRPTVTVDPLDTNLCDYSTLTLNASGAQNYLWTPSTYLSSNTGNSVVCTPLKSTSYTVIGVDSNGCSDTIQSTLTVGPNPTISVLNSPVCVGDTSYLIVSTSMPATFVWSNGAAGNNTFVVADSTSSYSVTASGINGCVSQAQAQVLVNQKPVLSVLTQDLEVCKGESISVSVSGAINYVWFTTSGINGATGSTQTFTPNANTTCTVIGTNVNGCVDTLVFDVIVHANPNVSILSSDTMICYKDSLLLEATGAVSYSWSSNGSFIANTYNSIYTTSLQTSQYIVIGTDGNGCQDKDTVLVDITPIPSISPSFLTACVGDSIQLDATSNLANTLFTWSNGLVGNSIVVYPNSDTTFSVLATDSLGCSASDSIYLEVLEMPIVTASTQKDTICSGSSTVLTALGANSYLWSPSGSLSSAGGSQTSASPDSTLTYTVIGTNIYGCTDTAEVSVNVIPGAHVSVSASNTSLCEGDSASLNASGALIYTWLPTTGLNSNTGASVIANPNTTRVYQVIGEIANGCKASASIKINVHALPQISFNTDTFHLCPTEKAQIQASGAAQYTWPASVLGNGSSVMVDPLTTTTYNVIGESAFGCIDSASVYVARHANPQVSLQQDSIHLCYGDSALFQLNDADSYAWSSHTNFINFQYDSIWVLGHQTASYAVIGSSAFGCTDTVSAFVSVSPKTTILISKNQICAGDSSVLTVQKTGANPMFLWNTGQTTSSITITPNTSTIYSVTVTDSTSCSSVDSAVVWVHQLPQIQFSTSDSVSICMEDSIFVQLSGASTYQWNPMIGVLPQTTSSVYLHTGSGQGYTVMALDSNGCQNTRDFNLSHYVSPNVSLISSVDTICGYSGAILSAIGAQSYVWKPNNFLQSISMDSVSVQPTQNITYEVVGTDLNGCQDTASKDLIVFGFPKITPSNPSVCPGDSVQITTNGGPGVVSYLWSTGSTANAIYVSPLADTYYYVTATFINGCIGVDSVLVSTHNALVVNASVSQAYSCREDSVVLTVDNGVQFQWGPSYGLTSVNDSVVGAYPQQTTTYKVIATDANGCYGEDSVTVNIYNTAQAQITSVTHVCVEDTVDLLATGSQTYQWLQSGGIVNSAGNILRDELKDTTLFQVVGTDANGCQDTASHLVYAMPAPVIQVTQGNSLVCQGDTLQLYASGAISYYWTPNQWIDSVTSSNPVVYPLANTIYYVEGIDSFGCSSINSVYVNVKRRPFININALNDSVCIGDSLMLTAKGAQNYTWSSPLITQNTTADTVWVLPTVSSQYTVTGISTDGCYGKAERPIHVSPLPSITISAADDTLCIGEKANLTVGGGASYEWFNTQVLSSPQDSVVSDDPTNTTLYTVQATSKYGCKNDTGIQVVVHQLPTFSLSNDTAVCFGDTALIAVQGNHSFQWFGNGLSNYTGNTTQAASTINQTYKIEATDTNGCVNSDSMFLTVHDSIAINPNFTHDTICINDSTYLQLDSLYSYNWLLPQTGIANHSQYLKPTLDTKYAIIAQDAFACMDTIEVNVKVNSLPQVVITTPLSEFCLGENSKLFASGAKNYTWSNLGNTVGSLDSLTVAPTYSTLYIVEGIDSNTCVNHDSIDITVFNLPNVNLHIQDTSLCFADTNTIVANGAVNYLWSGSIVNNHNDSVSISPAAGVQSYTVIGLDQNLCKDTASILLSVHNNPQLNIVASDTFICEANQFTIEGFSNMSPTTIIWNGADTMNQLISYPTQSSWFVAEGINEYGCHKQDSFYLSVNAYPVITKFQSDTIICFSDSIILSGMANTPGLKCNWVSGQTTDSICVSPNAVTNYTLIVKDSIGCSDTASVQVGVQALPTVNIQANSLHLCDGDTLDLNALKGNSVSQVLWNNMSTQYAQSLVVHTNTTHYTVEAMDSLGCKISDTLDVLVNPNPIISISSPILEICRNDSTTLNVTSSVSANSYLWSTGSVIAIEKVSPLQSAYVQATIQDSIGCTGTDSVFVKVNQLPVLSYAPSPASLCYGDTIEIGVLSNGPISSYSWNNKSVAQKIQVHPDTTTVYSVIVTDTLLCSDSIQIPVIVNANPIIEIKPLSADICSGDSILLTPYSTKPFSNSLWSNGDTNANIWVKPNTTKYFKVNIIDTDGCKGKDTIQVHIRQRPIAKLFALDSICTNDSSVVQYIGNAASSAVAAWNFDGAQIISGSGINPHWLRWSQPGIYNVSMTVTQNGCTSYPDTVSVNVFRSPVVEFVSASQQSCTGAYVDFQSLTYGMSSYLWDFGLTNTGMDTSSLEQGQFIYPYEGQFDVTLTVISSEGCMESKTLADFIKVHPSPRVDFHISDDKVNLNSSKIDFTDESINADSYIWNFDDAQSGMMNFTTQQDPFHVFQDTGRHNVRLIAENIHGCSDTITKSLWVEHETNIYVPKGFTPNGDGINDRFYVKGRDLDWDRFQITIYNRWGQMIYASTDAQDGWSGRDMRKGEDCPIGVYTIVVIVWDNKGRRQELKESLTIVR